jgi:hypothetical protein
MQRIVSFRGIFAPKRVLFYPLRAFTGKTESGHKYTTPYLKMRTCKPIYPPPGMDLEFPDWTPEEFLLRIGGDTY